MAKRLTFPFPVFFNFVKKTRENVAIDFFQFIMNGDGKKTLKIIITEVYRLHSRNLVFTRLQSIF